MSLPAITIYTDGACSPNPGPGGWGAVLLHANGRQEEISGSEPQSTNNRMELGAALGALRYLQTAHRVTLITDSKYLKDGITSWIHNWKKRGWLTASKEPVKNRDLWEALDQELLRHEVVWQWVRGHAANRWNERADALAVAARQHPGPCPEPLPAREPSVTPVQTAVASSCPGEIVQIYLAVTHSHGSGRGSWAVIFHYNVHYRILGRRQDGGSANRLHLEAAISALKSLKRTLPVHLYTSSGYLQSGAESWLAGWQRKGWKNSGGDEISNKAQWQELAGLLDRFQVTFHLVDKERNTPCLYQEAKELAKEWAT